MTQKGYINDFYKQFEELVNVNMKCHKNVIIKMS